MRLKASFGGLAMIAAAWLFWLAYQEKLGDFFALANPAKKGGR